MKQLILKIYTDKIMHPRKYDHVINVPGEFDCAEYLLLNSPNNLSADVKRRVDKILINGKSLL